MLASVVGSRSFHDFENPIFKPKLLKMPLKYRTAEGGLDFGLHSLPLSVQRLAQNCPHATMSIFGQ